MSTAAARAAAKACDGVFLTQEEYNRLLASIQLMEGRLKKTNETVASLEVALQAIDDAQGQYTNTGDPSPLARQRRHSHW